MNIGDWISVDGSKIVQEMFAFVEQDQREFAIEGHHFRSIKWHNPDKGETMDSEITRWRYFINVVYKINSYYDVQKDLYVFQKSNLPSPPKTKQQ